MEEKKITIYSYTKVWKVEKRIYALYGLTLPRPVNPYDLLAAVGVALVIYVVGLIIPIITAIPAIIRLGVFPYFIAGYLMKKKLDGKTPIKFVKGYIVYLLTICGYYLQAFQKHAEREKTVKLKWKCSMGVR